ncbi:MAG: hypothetical protein IKR13_03595 [Victivallales bacterium]|nr:hypothetical protein [Victivallales bacterium]
MNEEIFDSISDLLAKSGTTVSKNIDGSIVVSLPDSSEKLADCTDNGDGTVSYTMYLGDGTEEVGSGTPEEFKEHVLDALDSWIDYVPYDRSSVEPNVPAEYRRAIGESRDDVMRRSLFEMGLEDDQAEAIIEVANALMEASSSVSLTIDNMPLEGKNFDDLVERNKPFLTKKWLIKQLKDKNVDLGDLDLKKAGISALVEKLMPALSADEKKNGGRPTKSQLKEFVEQYRSAAQIQSIQSDDEVLGTAWNQFGKTATDKSSKTGGKAKATTAVMDNETPIESGEADDYDEEIGYKEVNRGAGDEDELKSEQFIADNMGDTVSVKDAVVTEKKNKNGDVVSQKLDGFADIEENNVDTEAEPVDDGDPMIKLWDGDASSIGREDLSDKYDIPGEALEQVEARTNQLKEAFNDILQSIPTIQSRPVSFVMQLLFGKAGGGLRGTVLRLINGDQDTLQKIERGKGILDISKATPAQRKELEDAMNTDTVKNAIAKIQHEFADYAAFIREILPVAYDEACNIESGSEQSAEGDVSEVAPDFVNMFRTFLFNKKCPFAGYPWYVVDKLCNNLDGIIKFSEPTGGSRKISGVLTGNPATTAAK